MNNIVSYIIITPAYNEADLIEQTIKSVVSQTVLPSKWIIVDDSSTDSTREIIKKHATQHNFIQYHFREKPKGQDYFASNVFAIMEGYEKIKHLSYDFLAILDADIQLPKNYYQKIIGKFQKDSQLGVASGIYENLINGKLHKVLNDRRSTPKAIQVFRRDVFAEIGGYLPLKYGGEDTISCVMTRMAGWKAWSFPDVKVVHLRPTGTGEGTNIIAVRFRQGICEYNLATHAIFFFLKVLRRAVLEKPYFIGGMTRLAGYLWATLRQDEIVLPADVVRFLRNEHLERIRNRNRIE